MKITIAKEKDIKEIISLLKIFSVSKNSEESGFVNIKIPTQEEIKNQLNPYYLVAKNNNFYGFLSSYNYNTLKEKLNDDPIVKYLIQNKKNFYYSEYCAVKKEYQHQNIATQLFNNLFNRLKKGDIIYGVICHKPKNTASINLVNKVGFEFEEEKEISNILFGIYKKII